MSQLHRPPLWTTEAALRRVVATYAAAALLRCLDPVHYTSARRRFMRLLDRDLSGLDQMPREIWWGATADLQLSPREQARSFKLARPGLILLISDLKYLTQQPAFKHLGSVYRDRRSGSRPTAAPGLTATVRFLSPGTAFSAALRNLLFEFDDSAARLHRALMHGGLVLDLKTLLSWLGGGSSPRHGSFLPHIALIERRYGLQKGRLRQLTRLRPKRPRGFEATTLRGGSWKNERWHLPDDYDDLTPERQAEIQEWLRLNILPGKTTTYRKWHQVRSRQRHALPLPYVRRFFREVEWSETCALSKFSATLGSESDPMSPIDFFQKPTRLEQEVVQLMEFKTALFPPVGVNRSGHWSKATAEMNLRKIESVLGVLQSRVLAIGTRSRSTDIDLRMGHLVFPAVWETYLSWRLQQRGFFTVYERDLLGLAAHLFRGPWGWAFQTRDLASNLPSLPGLVTVAEVEAAAASWGRACERMADYARSRGEDLSRVQTRHRDHFEAVASVLEADKPLDVYCRIAAELRTAIASAPPRRIERAELTRTLAMFCVAIHTGLRQRNLRELLICRPGSRPLSEATLQRLRRGEMRYCEREGRWKLLIPASAFKNSSSSFFLGRSVEMGLPASVGVSEIISEYVLNARPILVGKGRDPGTFLVKTNRRNVVSLELSKGNMYNSWYEMTVRFGIYNPYTKRGAIAGMLAHGPHAVRDVIATHVLKQTGSFELAGFAIQDTAETVMRHYARFSPTAKARLAATVVSRSWSDLPLVGEDDLGNRG